MAEEEKKKPSHLDRLFADRKIERALMQLELTFAECSGFVVFDEEERTASWRYNKETGEESIHVGLAVANLDVTSIEMVLRHEILHRSMYHAFGEKYEHPDLSNLALDICINRLLFEAYSEEMRKLSTAIYPEEAKTTPVALADCTADPARLPTELGELWLTIWRQDRDGQFTPLNPASLYFRLARLLAIGVIQKFTPFYIIGHDLPRRPGRTATQLARNVASQINKKLPRGSDLGRALSDFNVVPVSVGSSDVEQFLEKMRLRKIQDQTAKKVLAPLIREIRVQPFPAFPTRLGLVYQMCGISELLGLYWNKEIGNTGARMAVGIYMDVSGSMMGNFGLVAGFVEALKEVPLRVRVFDTEVREIDVETLVQGRITGGGGTDFDAPIKDMLGDREIEAGVLFTDGEADVTSPVAARLRASTKRLFVVYLLDSSYCSSAPRSVLNRLAKDTIVVPIGSR